MKLTENHWFFLCRGGSKTENKGKGDPREISKFIRLTGCPFQAHATFHKPSCQWYFTVDNTSHNHPSSTNPCAHVQNCFLTPAQFDKFKELSKGGLKPSAILNVLHANKKEGESLLVTKNTIYVTKRRVKMESLQGLSPIVHMKNQPGNSD